MHTKKIRIVYVRAQAILELNKKVKIYNAI
jgi:hypothetical protein